MLETRREERERGREREAKKVRKPLTAEDAEATLGWSRTMSICFCNILTYVIDGTNIRKPEPSFGAGVNMANDVKAMYTINHATIFPVVTNAVVGNVDPSCVSDVCLYRQRRQHIDTSRAQWHKR